MKKRTFSFRANRGPVSPKDPGALKRNVGALIIRIRFWGFLSISIVQNTPKPYSNL